MDIKKCHFQKHDGGQGCLIAVEAERDFPFPIRRVYYIYGVGSGVRRGFHAHKTLEQILICLHGSCKIMLDNGRERETVLLDDPSEGLYIGHATWREMYDFSPDAVLAVLASEYYSEADYIRNYNDYLAYLKM